MTRTLIALSAVLSICVAGGQTLGDDSPGMASDPGSGTEPASVSNVPGLVSVVQLNEGQVASLRRLNYEFEDELFPLLQQLREKEWELQRLSRSKDVDETMVDMVIQSIEALYEQVRSVGVRHREQARAMLSSHQLGALGKLETALELSDAAREAVCANLITTPGAFEYIPGLASLYGDPLGLGSCSLGFGASLVNGGFGDYLEGTQNDTSTVPGRN